jgi:hypothetical protein
MASARPLIDHDDIREWAEARGAKPACVRRTGGKGDPGMIRLDFPGFSGARSLAPLRWDEWFKAFDANNLALLVQDTTSRGGRSNFNKLVSRDSVKATGRKRRSASRSEGRRGTGRTAGTRKAGGQRRTQSGRSTRSTARSTATDRSAREKENDRSSGRQGTARKAGGQQKSQSRSRSTTGSRRRR